MGAVALLGFSVWLSLAPWPRELCCPHLEVSPPQLSRTSLGQRFASMVILNPTKLRLTIAESNQNLPAK